VKWEGYPDAENMWVDKDDVFADDKVREFKASNPDAITHIRGASSAKSPHSPLSTHSQYLYQHALSYMSSDGNNDFADEYPAGAIADSPIPLSHEFPIDTPVHVQAPIPVVDFTTLQPLSITAPTFVPRPVTASSSSSDVAAMFRQLRVHTPTPLTPDGQRAAEQATEMFAISFTPAEGRRGQASVSVEQGAALGSEAAVGTTPTMPRRCRADSNGSATDYDLRQCARCGEQNQYCHGHTPIIPNASLDLPPRLPLQASVQSDGMARVNLNRTQATALASRLINALENHQDAAPVPPAHDYGEEVARIVAEGLGIDQAVAAEGLGVCTRGSRGQGRGQGNRPQSVPDARHPAHAQQAQGPRAPRRVSSPVPAGFEHNRGPAFIPFRIRNKHSGETPARYIRAHIDAPNPFVEGRLSLNRPTYHSEIHAASVVDVDIPPPLITADILRLLDTDYMGYDRVDEALGELGDRSLRAEVNRYRRLERKCKAFQESICRLEDQMFTTDVERHMCVSRLEGARAMVRIQGAMQDNRQAFRLSPWSLERGCLP
jgi:hypothetical protein